MTAKKKVQNPKKSSSSRERELGPRERARMKLEAKKKKIRKKNRALFCLTLFAALGSISFYRAFFYIPPTIEPATVILVPEEEKQEEIPVNSENSEDILENIEDSVALEELDVLEKSEELHEEELEEVEIPTITSKILDSLHCDDQRQTLPEGCEVTSLSAVLNFHGVATDKMVLSEEYLPRSGLYDSIKDPDAAYVGNPASVGWYCFEAPLVVCANNYLADVGSDLKAEIGHITEKQQFIDYINNDTPLIVWLTTNYGMPYHSFKHSWYDGSENTNPYYNLHVVTLVGYDEEAQLFYIADSLKPKGEDYVELNMDTFMEIYTAMECRSVVIS